MDNKLIVDFLSENGVALAQLTIFGEGIPGEWLATLLFGL